MILPSSKSVEAIFPDENYSLNFSFKLEKFFNVKRCFEINLGILLTWIRIRIHQILLIRMRIQSMRIHITEKNSVAFLDNWRVGQAADAGDRGHGRRGAGRRPRDGALLRYQGRLR